MQKKNLTHSKLKNAGILFELLVRQITVDMMGGQSSSPAVSLVKKYFAPSTELGKELQCYRAFFDTKKLNETRAIQYIDLITEQRRKLNERKLLTEKYNLIKEVKDMYVLTDFLQAKIPSYKMYASIYKTFMAEIQDTVGISNIKEIATSRFTLIEHLINDHTPKETQSKLYEQLKNQSEDLRSLAYRLVLNKFNQKYDGLNPDQKTLLREYINNISSNGAFSEYIKTQIPTIKQNLITESKKINNRVLEIKVGEVASQLDTLREKKMINESDLTALMISYQILHEMRNG